MNVDTEGYDRGTDSTLKFLSKATKNIGPRFNDKRTGKEKVSTSQVYSWKITYKFEPKAIQLN